MSLTLLSLTFARDEEKRELIQILTISIYCVCVFHAVIGFFGFSKILISKFLPYAERNIFQIGVCQRREGVQQMNTCNFFGST